MLLSDNCIKAAIAAGTIGIEPYSPEMVQPASIDVRLDNKFILLDPIRGEYRDPASGSNVNKLESPVLQAEEFYLKPGDFILGSTLERVKIPADMSARFEGKSSLGRIGLLTHITAGFIDPGFEGHITVELSNVSPVPIKLYSGMKIGQLCFMSMCCASESPYGSGKVGSHYQGQRGPTASRIHENFHRTIIV